MSDFRCEEFRHENCGEVDLNISPTQTEAHYVDRILAQLGFVLPLTSCFVTEGGAGVELRSLVMVAQSVERHTCMHTHIPHDLIALCNAFLSLSQTAVYRKQSGRRGEKSSFPVCSNAMHWERSLTHARGKIMRYFLPLMWLKQKKLDVNS